MLAVLVGSTTALQAPSKLSLSKVAEAVAPLVAASVLATGAMPAFAGDSGSGEQVKSTSVVSEVALILARVAPDARFLGSTVRPTRLPGPQIFSGNCAACHAGGQNVIMPEKTLEQSALEEYLDGGFNEGSVVKQVTKGKNAMPAFGGRLSDSDIANARRYVESKVAQPLVSWLSGGLLQRQSMPQAAPSSG